MLWEQWIEIPSFANAHNTRYRLSRADQPNWRYLELLVFIAYFGFMLSSEPGLVIRTSHKEIHYSLYDTDITHAVTYPVG